MSALTPLLQDALALSGRHLVSGLVVAARLLPVVFLCPLLGGQAAPPTVRLTVTAALGLYCVGPLGQVLPAPTAASAERWVPLLALEALFGFALALAASLPFDAARTAGRLVDLLRGSASDVASLLSASRESASGELLQAGLVAMAARALGAGALARALLHTYAWAPVGLGRPGETLGGDAVALLSAAFAAAVAVAAPAAAVSLGVDGLLGLAARAAPRLGLGEQAPALRILLGTAALWLLLANGLERLLAGVLALPELLARGPGLLP